MLASAKSPSAFDHFEDFCRRVAFERFDTFDENRQNFRAARVPARARASITIPISRLIYAYRVYWTHLGRNAICSNENIHAMCGSVWAPDPDTCRTLDETSAPRSGALR